MKHPSIPSTNYLLTTFPSKGDGGFMEVLEFPNGVPVSA